MAALHLQFLVSDGLFQGSVTDLSAVIKKEFPVWLQTVGVPEEAFTVGIKKDSSDFHGKVARLFLADTELVYPASLVGEIGFSISNAIPDRLLEEEKVVHLLAFPEQPAWPLYLFSNLFREICQLNSDQFITPEVIDSLIKRLIPEANLNNARRAFAGYAFRELIKSKWLHRLQKKGLEEALFYVSDQDSTSITNAYEHLLDLLGDPEVTLHVSEHYLKQVTIRKEDGSLEAFKKQDEQLFFDIGIDFPDVRLQLDNTLADETIRFSLNGLASLTFKSLAAGEYWVSDMPAALQHAGYSYSNCLHPVTFQTGYRILAENKNDLVAYNPVSPVEFMALMFYRYMHHTAWQFITISRIKELLDETRLTSPAIVNLALKQYPLSAITAVFRSLIKEKISLRNIFLVLQSLIDFDRIEVEGSKYIVFDSRLPVADALAVDGATIKEALTGYLTEFARMNLKNYISYRSSGGTLNLNVYLLDPAIEEQLIRSAGRELSPQERSEILQEVQVKMGPTWREPQNATILTIVEVRPILKKLIERQFPFINVISYQELLPSMQITPYDRIMLN